MKTILIDQPSLNVQQLLDFAKEQDVLIQTTEGDEFLLSLIDDFSYEIAKQRQNEKLMAFLDERARQARNEETIPYDEVCRKLGLNTDD